MTLLGADVLYDTAQSLPLPSNSPIPADDNQTYYNFSSTFVGGVSVDKLQEHVAKLRVADQITAEYEVIKQNMGFINLGKSGNSS